MKLLWLCLFLVGCECEIFDATYERAKELCIPMNGVNYVESVAYTSNFQHAQVVCRDGTVIDFRVSLK